MQSTSGSRLPRVAAVIGSPIEQREFRVALQGYCESLWVLPSIGELRGSPYLYQLDLLVVDLTGDRQSKLAFIQATLPVLTAKVVALIPQGADELRVAAIKAGVETCIRLPASSEDLRKGIAAVWGNLDGHSGAPAASKAPPSAARRLAERLSRAGGHSVD